MNKKEKEKELENRIKYLESFHMDDIIKLNFENEIRYLFYNNRFIDKKCYLAMNKEDVLKIVEEKYDFYKEMLTKKR